MVNLNQMNFELICWQKEFANELAKAANNKKIAMNMRDTFPYPFTSVTAEWFIKDYLYSEPESIISYAIMSDGRFVGSITSRKRDDVYSKCCELGYFIAEEYWGNGIASNAIRIVTEESFTKLDVVRVIAEPFADNIPSRRALEKAGFMLEGILKKNIYKYDEFHDSCIYAFVR